MEDSSENREIERQPIGEKPFCFECHPGVSCFTFCCKNVNLTLYPYDVIRLKNCLSMDSEVFMRNHTFLEKADNPYFPAVKLKLVDDSQRCPFLRDDGCQVYSHRPSACRTYPLERGVVGDVHGAVQDIYFMTDHDYCKGHNEQREYTVNGWIRSQGLIDYNTMNSLWAEMDMLFRTNPWKGEGAGGERQQLAFMVCYNIDGFRRFCDQHNLINQYQLEKDFRKRIKREDSELQKFGFEWLKLILNGKSSLVKK